MKPKTKRTVRATFGDLKLWEKLFPAAEQGS